MATILLRAAALAGTVEFRYADAEIACVLCNGGAGAIYPNENATNELLAIVTVAGNVHEPARGALVALGLLLLWVGRALPRPSTEPRD